MTEEEIGRFALVLAECERVRAMMEAEAVALSDEGQDGIPVAAAPPEQWMPAPALAAA